VGRAPSIRAALGGRTATLTVRGRFYSENDAPFRVRGTIRGREVAALVEIY
jgi:hypothetical protein